MTTHYLRMEGVNLGSFVFDTRDLSTNRGGSLMLLQSVKTAERVLREQLDDGSVAMLSSGASSGLFALTLRCPEDAEHLANAVRGKLLSDFPHATFVVDITPHAQHFRPTVEALMASNRWRQMQSASLAIPERSPDLAGKPDPVCAVDNLRPAGTEAAPKHRGGHLSCSVADRREHGRRAKQSFYAPIVDRVANEGGQLNAWLEHSSFAHDFEDIASDPRHVGDTLAGKLAVFYADGNSFGAIQSSQCSDAKRQTDFDRYLQARREHLMVEVLASQLAAPEDWTHQQDGGADRVIRFETLLWGGDEVMFVMPAAVGWRFATLFFRSLGDMDLSRAGSGLQGKLTHAAALVYCHHHAPIDRIKRLAKDQMAEFAKTQSLREANALAVVALESFDHLGLDFTSSLARRYGSHAMVDQSLHVAADSLPLADRLTAIAETVSALRQNPTFARSQLRRLVAERIAALREGHVAAPQDRWEPPAHFRFSDERAIAALKQLLPLYCTGNPPAIRDDTPLWICLEELWDYATP